MSAESLPPPRKNAVCLHSIISNMSKFVYMGLRLNYIYVIYVWFFRFSMNVIKLRGGSTREPRNWNLYPMTLIRSCNLVKSGEKPKLLTRNSKLSLSYYYCSSSHLHSSTAKTPSRVLTGRFKIMFLFCNDERV